MIGIVPEQSTAVYSAQLTDENDADIALGSLNSITLTLYNYNTGAIINSRSAQDIKNANNVAISSTGALVWTLQPEDNVIVDDTVDEELHVALIQGVYATVKKFKHEVAIGVTNLEKVS